MNESVTPPGGPERWLPVPGYEGFYEASDLGRVRSLNRKQGNRQLRGKVLKPSYAGPAANVGLSRDGRIRTFKVHALVARTFLGPCPEGHEVCHGPAGRFDNRLINLSYGTHAKNNGEDKRRDGTFGAKLTDEIVRECRIRAAAGESCSALAREFGVQDSAMLRAVAGTAWRHVAQPPYRRERKPRARSAPGKQIVPVRWDAPLLQAIRLHAKSRGLTFSDVVRLAVTDYLEKDSPPP